MLDAGVALLEEAGYEGFTIAAVCERAQVPPRATCSPGPLTFSVPARGGRAGSGHPRDHGGCRPP